MYSKIHTCTLTGLIGELVEVEANIAQGLMNFSIVGLPDASIKESKDRVRAALTNSGYKFPLGRITINLAPANLRKEGSQLDLPIAISILCAMGVLEGDDRLAVFGELALDGRVMGISGALPMVISLRELGIKEIIVPFDNQEECAVVNDVSIYPVKTLAEVVSLMSGESPKKPAIPAMGFKRSSYDVDFSDMQGQENIKRAMEIAAAGNHPIMMVGPPGSGKSMSAVRLPTILPDLSFDEAIETTKIYSVAGEHFKGGLMRERPFRAPHHTASQAALVGGGRIPKPGEISLAHNGVLFLDELPEFSKSVIEVLRQPLESHSVTVSRVNATVQYPANFLLVAAANPCPCGYYGDPNHECTCSIQQINNYLSKISNPLLDRIDLHIAVEPVAYKDLNNPIPQESSETIRQRVIAARERQKVRFAEETIQTNSELSSKQVRAYIPMTPGMEKIMALSFDRYGFSARTFNKILKISRTIADLEGEETVGDKHLLEAIRYRTLARKYFE